MRPNFWNSLDNVNWKRLWLCVFAAGASWAVLSLIIPAHLHTVITAILGAISVGLGILIRGSKYIKDRNEIPQIPGVPI